MIIFFANAEPIDLAAIEVMGVNVKADAQSAIGYFGTGLKFALATLLRHRQSVTLWRAGERIDFAVLPEVIRGKTFDRVAMNGKPLGFTTDLGRNWELWQAFRELESNCRDEKGHSGRTLTHLQPELVKTHGTVFCIEGEAFDHVYEQRDIVFLNSTPLASNDSVEIHPLSHHDTALVYYRGVRAGKLPFPGAFTYNILAGASLTEDRTVELNWMFGLNLGKIIAETQNQRVARDFLLAGKGTFEHQNVIHWPGKFGEVASGVIKKKLFSPNLNAAARRSWLDAQPHEEEFEAASLTDAQHKQLGEALRLVRHVGGKVGVEDLNFANGLGPDVFGAVTRGKIYIATRTFDMGTRFLASTIYEEWLHKSEGYEDNSRSLQNFLFEKLMSWVERDMENEDRNGRQGETIGLSKQAKQDTVRSFENGPMFLPNEEQIPALAVFGNSVDDDIPF